MSASRPGGPKAPRSKRPLSEDRKAELNTAPYDQGFGKPPRTAQFKKGVSGNPSGRPKASRALRTDVLEVLDLEVQVQLPQGAQSVSMQHAMVLSMAAKAAKGDTRAAMVVLRLMEVTVPERLKEAPEATRLDPSEQAMFDSLLAGMGLAEPATELVPDVPAAAPARGTDDERDWDIL